MFGHILSIKSIVPTLSAGALFAFGLLMQGCSSEKAKDGGEAVVVQIGSSRLTRSEINSLMPGGMSQEDSARYVNAYINNWIDARLVSEVAAGELDMTEIDRLVDDYRNTLIMQEYRRKMFETHAATIPDDSIKTYYDRHAGEFILDRPMVKGTYLKVPDDARNLAVLRRLYRSEKPADVDKLEKEVLSSAIHYDYFRDRWVDWEQIESRIPYDFGEPSIKWIAKNKHLEHSRNGYTYLLYISDVLPAGQPMPVEVARKQIVNRILNQNRKAYDAELMQALRDKAEQDGRLKISGY